MPERENTLQGVLPEAHPPHPHHTSNLWVGILLLLISLAIQIFVDLSTHPQAAFSCRLVLALGAALIGSYLGEFFKIKFKIPHIEAYGAAALFLIVFLLEPFSPSKTPVPVKPELQSTRPKVEACWHTFPPEIFEPIRTDNLKNSRSDILIRGISFHQSFSNNYFRQLILNHLKKGFRVRILALAPMSRFNEVAAKQFCMPLDHFTMDSLISTYKLKTLLEEYKGHDGKLEVRFYESMPTYRFEYYGSNLASLFQRYALFQKNGFFVKPAEILQEYSETEAVWGKATPLQLWLMKYPQTDISSILSGQGGLKDIVRNQSNSM